MSIQGGIVMCKAAEVGKIVINKCIEANLPLDVQKLQKLLALMQVECIRQSGKPLFKEDLRILDCGVAIKEVDDEFRGYGENFYSHQDEYINLLDQEENSVNYVINEYGEKDVFFLKALPIMQKIESLGVLSNDFKVPHINVQILIGAFFEK